MGLIGCASSKKATDESMISNGAIGDLARSSYLKGCVDALTSTYKQKSKGIFFEQCVVKAKLHQTEILEIISPK